MPRLLAVPALLLLPAALSAQRRTPTPTEPAASAPIANVRYEVVVDRAALANRRLHVTTRFDVGSRAPVVLSLPAWTPGAYEVGNFARNVLAFAATQEAASLTWEKVDPDSWRVTPTGAGTVAIEFDYIADSLDNAMSWTRPDFALFNGTNLFLYPEGRPLTFPSTVEVRTESDFNVVTGMTWTGRGRQYRAPNYHELVDMPFFVGRFDLDSASVSGKWVRYATYPRGSVAGALRAQLWSQLKRIIPVEAAVFGEAPWADYSVMQIADSSFGGYSGLEHASSHVDIVATAGLGAAFVPSLYAHEIFHSWNVKRLRPSELVPYDYHGVQPTPWLWVSEGITDYYADLAEVRAGVVDARGFYALTTGKIAEIAQTVPFALEDASLNTWIHPRDGTSYSYYPKGSLAGLMLDVMIRDASDNRRSLDTVMRELYETTFKQGRGFTSAEFWASVRRAAGGRSFADFNARYVDGRDPYPWPEILSIIGLRMTSDSVPRLGVSTRSDSTNVLRVTELVPGGAAERSGMKVGDILTHIGGAPVDDPNFGPGFRARFRGKPAGTPISIVVRRGDQSVTLTAPLTYAPGEPTITEDPAASPRAVRLRNGILLGETARARPKD